MKYEGGFLYNLVFTDLCRLVWVECSLRNPDCSVAYSPVSLTLIKIIMCKVVCVQCVQGICISLVEQTFDDNCLGTVWILF